MVLLVLVNIGLVDTSDRLPVEVRIFRLHHGLLQEAIVLRLESHDLGLLASHPVNSIDQIGDLLFFTSRAILHVCLRRVSSHLLQLESSLISRASLEHLPLVLRVNILITLIILGGCLVVRQSVVAIALCSKVVLLVLHLWLLIVVDSITLTLILHLRVNHATLVVFLVCLHI